MTDRQLKVGDKLLTLPTAPTTIGVHTKDESTFRGTLEEWAAVGGLTFRAGGSGQSAWVSVADAEGSEVATIYGTVALAQPIPDLTNQTIDAVEAIIAEATS